MEHVIAPEPKPIGAPRQALVKPIVREIIKDIPRHEARMEGPAKVTEQDQRQAQDATYNGALAAGGMSNRYLSRGQRW
jgi:hypothetical protein